MSMDLGSISLQPFTWHMFSVEISVEEIMSKAICPSLLINNDKELSGTCCVQG